MIDDPFGSMEDAESEVIREKVWKWYCGTIYNRLQPGGAIVLIGHRLHQDDLHGGAYRWGIVLLPAIAEAPSELNEWAEDPLGRAAGAPLWQQAYPWRRVRVHGQARPSVSFKAPFDREICVLMTEISASLGMRPRAGPPRSVSTCHGPSQRHFSLVNVSLWAQF